MAKKGNNSQAEEKIYLNSKNFKVSNEGMFELVVEEDKDGGKHFEWDRICDFPIHLMYLLKDKDKVSRIAQVGVGSDCKFIEIPNDVICSEARLNAYLFAHQKWVSFTKKQLGKWLSNVGSLPVAQNNKLLGYSKEADAFFWANAVLHSDQIYKPNEYGIVSFGDKAYFMPYIDNVSSDAEESEFANNFVYSGEHTISFNDWYSLIKKAYPTSSVMVTAFNVMSCFRDIIFDKENFTPTLFVYGPASSGKTSFCKLLTKWWGKQQNEISFNSPNTDKSIPTMLAQVSNAPILINEWHPDLPQAQQNLLQGFWDGAGYKKATLKGGIESVDIMSTLMMTSNFIPTYFPFFTRQIIIEMSKDEFTEVSTKAYEKLKEYDNLSCISREIVCHRDLIVKNYKDKARYNRLYIKDVFRQKKISLSERYVDNMAVLITPLTILIENGAVSLGISDNPTIETEFVMSNAIDNILRQTDLWEHLGGMGQYLEQMSYAFDKGKFQHDVDFRIISQEIDGVMRRVICIKRPNFYKVYESVVGTSKAKKRSDIEELFDKSPLTIHDDKNVAFRQKEEISKWTSGICYKLDYEQIKEKYHCSFENE